MEVFNEAQEALLNDVVFGYNEGQSSQRNCRYYIYIFMGLSLFQTRLYCLQNALICFACLLSISLSNLTLADMTHLLQIKIWNVSSSVQPIEKVGDTLAKMQVGEVFFMFFVFFLITSKPNYCKERRYFLNKVHRIQVPKVNQGRGLLNQVVCDMNVR